MKHGLRKTIRKTLELEWRIQELERQAEEERKRRRKQRGATAADGEVLRDGGKVHAGRR